VSEDEGSPKECWVNLISWDVGLHCDAYYFFFFSSPFPCVFDDDISGGVGDA